MMKTLQAKWYLGVVALLVLTGAGCPSNPIAAGGLGGTWEYSETEPGEERFAAGYSFSGNSVQANGTLEFLQPGFQHKYQASFPGTFTVDESVTPKRISFTWSNEGIVERAERLQREATRFINGLSESRFQEYTGNVGMSREDAISQEVFSALLFFGFFVQRGPEAIYEINGNQLKMEFTRFGSLPTGFTEGATIYTKK